jgi:hypothetical protein
MIEGLDDFVESGEQMGLRELRELLVELLGGPGAAGRLIDHQVIKSRVRRLCFDTNGGVRSVVVKRLDPDQARRNELVARRWLPAIGLEHNGPPLLGVAAERSGRSVWHVYEDLGDTTLAASVNGQWPGVRVGPRALATGHRPPTTASEAPEPRHVAAAVELLARIHTRFAGHALLAECRMGGDLGIYYFTSNVKDAIHGLESLRPACVEMSSERLALRDRVLERMYKLLDEQPDRAQTMAELGGPDTLLHGDLWTTNVVVETHCNASVPAQNGLHARLIDWDHAAVGPISYDLSTFLARFPSQDRPWILDLYRESVGRGGWRWRLPCASTMNLLFDTAECARLANRVVWAVIGILDGEVEWGFQQLEAFGEWLEVLEPVLP